MNSQIAGALLIGLSFTACDRIPFLGGGSDGPVDVARSFWEAMQAGDTELAQTFATGSESVSLTQPDSGGTGITNVQVGEAAVDGERANVPTTLTNTLASTEPSDLAFSTMLVQVDGDWRVDLDPTMDEVTRGIMGVSMTDLTDAMGNAVTGAMQGMMEGMTDSTTRQTPAEQPQPRVTPPTPQPRPQPQQPTGRTVVASEVPFTPRAGTVSPGMTPDQVVEAWGQPVTERQHGQWTYMFFRNGCENRCGTFDVVFFQNGQVVDAVVRTPAHTYTGVSSSPPDNVAGFTPPSVTGIGGLDDD